VEHYQLQQVSYLYQTACTALHARQTRPRGHGTSRRACRVGAGRVGRAGRLGCAGAGRAQVLERDLSSVRRCEGERASMLRLGRPVGLEENPILTFYDIILTNIIWRFMISFCTIFNFFSKRLKVSFCDFSTAIFFFAFLISYYDIISFLMAACVMVLYHEVQ